MPDVDVSRASMSIAVDRDRLIGCLRSLRDAAKPPDLVEVTLARKVNQDPNFAWLGFVTAHVEGWWERIGMPVALAGRVKPRRVVVDLAALTERVESIRSAFADRTMSLGWLDSALVVGGTALEARATAIPEMPVVGALRDRVFLAGAGAWRGAIIETEQGRVAVAPPVIAHLQRRDAAVAEFGSVDGEVFLVANAEQRAQLRTAPVIIAPVQLISWTEEAELGQVKERRRGGHEVEQLLAALDPDTPIDTLLELLDTSIGYIRRRVAAHPGLPEAVIDEIAAHGTVAMRVGVAGNPALSERNVRRLISDPEIAVRTAVAANEEFAPELVGALAWDLDAGVRAAVAMNPRLPWEARALLAGDPIVAVRQVVAAHPGTDPALLAVLARDPEPAVCGAVASNPSCPASLLDDLIAVAPLIALGNPNISPRLLVAGVRAADPTVRARVAANPAAPERVLSTLSRDRDEEVLRAVVANPSVSRGARDRAEKRLGTVDA